MIKKSFLAEDNPPLGEIVRRDFQRYLVADGNPDEIFAHLAGYMGKYLAPVLKLDAVHGRRQNFYNDAVQAERFFFCLMVISRHNYRPLCNRWKLLPDFIPFGKLFQKNNLSTACAGGKRGDLFHDQLRGLAIGRFVRTQSLKFLRTDGSAIVHGNLCGFDSSRPF